MDEKTDGRTAMERLCRELMDELLGNFVTAYCWCKGYGISVVGSTIDEDIEHARADIKRRIKDASGEDECTRTYPERELKRMTGMYLDGRRCTRGEVNEIVDAVEGWKAKASEMDALCLELGVDGPDNAADAVRDLVDEHYELKDLRKAGRIMPDGMRWPRYADGEQVRIGDVLRTRGMMHGEYRVVGVSACGMASVVAEDVEDDDNIALLDPELMDRAPRAVGADGVEVRPGDTVWMDGSDVEWVVRGVVGGLADLRDSRSGDGYYNDEGGVDCSRLTHERPDSWGRLKRDARKCFVDYWVCGGIQCEECRATEGGARPFERYECTGCEEAMRLDVLDRAERLAGVESDA